MKDPGPIARSGVLDRSIAVMPAAEAGNTVGIGDTVVLSRAGDEVPGTAVGFRPSGERRAPRTGHAEANIAPQAGAAA